MCVINYFKPIQWLVLKPGQIYGFFPVACSKVRHNKRGSSRVGSKKLGFKFIEPVKYPGSIKYFAMAGLPLRK